MGQVQFKTQAQLADEAHAAWRESAKVSAFQAEQALDELGYLTQVETLMADAATPKKTKRAWEKAQEFRRTSPTVLEMASALNLTEDELDALFKHAETIDA